MLFGTTTYDVAIIGGGIVGIATAKALADQTNSSIIVLEKEDRVASHQTGHNSGVIHSGTYYKPGSLKARLCCHGRELLYTFCEQNGIKYLKCGKLVVATTALEQALLDELYRRGQANGLRQLKQLGPDELKDYEPHVRGVSGLWVGETGIVDFAEVTEAMCTLLNAAGHEIKTNAGVTQIFFRNGSYRLITSRGEIQAKFLINCAGLESDRVARLCGIDPGLCIVPFRGEYYELSPTARHLVRNIVYPVPDPRYPFLGVHFTQTLTGGMMVGPNAVLAFSRRGYTRWCISFRDICSTISFSGFRRLLRIHWRVGLSEFYRSLNKRAFVRAAQRLIPEVDMADLVKGGAGVRAQAVEPSGALVDDFRIITTEHSVHVLNAPSPAATASLAIGEHIVETACRSFCLAVQKKPI